MYIYMYIYTYISIYVYTFMYMPRAGFKCDPHGTLPWSECTGHRYTPPRGPRGYSRGTSALACQG